MTEVGSLGILSVLPPIAAIVLAIWTKQVYLSLFAGIWIAWTILNAWNPLAGLVQSVDSLVAIFADTESTMIILLTVMIGALLTFTQYSGGMGGFVAWMTEKGIVKTRRSAGLLAWMVSVVIFVESTIGVLISGAVTRPLFDRLRISREKLSYILDSTCSAKAMLIPLNTWGAYITGLLIAQGVEAPVGLLATSLPLNFYGILAVGAALVVGVTNLEFGPMASAERRVVVEGKILRDGAEPLVAAEVLAVAVKEGVRPRPLNMLVPIGAVVISLPVLLLVTGAGDLMSGSGSVSAFWAVIMGLAVGGVMYRVQGIMSLNEITDMFMKGVGGMIPVGLLLVLAFGIGNASQALGTGPYVAQVTEAGLSPVVVPAALFVVSGIISFATGTSFGTWAIMTPIVIPMAGLMDLHPGLAFAAVLGGGLFGDHSSPISDSTIIASMAAGADHIDHVRTQLPYTLVVAGASLLLYLGLGLVL
jgi:Na+/H+ antiporter NhaC